MTPCSNVHDPSYVSPVFANLSVPELKRSNSNTKCVHELLPIALSDKKTLQKIKKKDDREKKRKKLEAQEKEKIE